MALTPEEVFQYLNRLFILHRNQNLSQIQKEIVIGVCLGETYQDIADRIYKSHDYIRTTASLLYKEIAEIKGVKCNKKNLVVLVEQLIREEKNVVILENRYQQEVIIDNPFIPLNGCIDRPQYFFNRQREIKKTFNLINAGSSVSVVGDRQIGKSSLLKAIARAAANSLSIPQHPIYLNLQKIRNEDEFYRYLCDEIGIEPCDSFHLDKALEGQKFLLLIDEIEKMNGNGFSYHVRDKLRSLTEGSKTPLRLVVASQLPLDRLFEEDRAEGRTSPLDNICIQVTLKPWDEQTSRNFIAARLEPTKIQFAETKIAQLIADSGGHPRNLMGLCHEHYENCKQS